MITELIYALPIELISLMAIVAIIIDSFSKSRTIIYMFSIIGLLIVGFSALCTLYLPNTLYSIVNYNERVIFNMITYGGSAAFFDMLFCLAAILTIFVAKPYLNKESSEYKEFYSLIILSVSGMMLIAHAKDLLILFIGIEIMSVSFYVLSGFFRTSIRSVEAALKYFLLGAFATGFLLYGIAMIYGATHTTNLEIIVDKFNISNYNSLYLTIGLGLLVIGLCFKIAAFPFHQWAPDVYQGAPSVVTGFMSTAGKAAAFAGFIIIGKNLITLYNGDHPHLISNILAVISAGTMLIGNLTALIQKNVKRMLAYSSVAHAGYMLMGIVAGYGKGWSGIAFYAVAYLFMQLGAFTIVSILEKNKDEKLEIEDYSGLNKSHPVLAAMMAIFMFSLVGLPPFAGFFGKYYLFLTAIQTGYTWLTIIAVVASIISVYFYIGLVLKMYFSEPPENPLIADKGTSRITLIVCTAGLLIFGILPSFLIDWLNKFF
jgi:NADH-quinone oxidoreductase subunit N